MIQHSTVELIEGEHPGGIVLPQPHVQGVVNCHAGVVTGQRAVERLSEQQWAVRCGCEVLVGITLPVLNPHELEPAARPWGVKQHPRWRAGGRRPQRW